MKLVPPFFRTIYDLPWSGGSVDALTWRRLCVRVVIATLALMLIGFVLTIPGMIAGWNILTLIPGIGGGICVATLLIWFVYQWTKINVLRMRHLGIEKTSHIIAIYLLVCVGGIAAASLKIYYLREGAMMSAHWAAICVVPSVLFNGILCFREKPLWASRSILLNPLDNNMKGEKIAQFLLETYMWFTVLRTPLDVIFL